MSEGAPRSSADRILVINCGSSSVKYKLYEPTVGSPLAGGIIEGIGAERGFHHHWVGPGVITEEVEVSDYRSAVAKAIEALTGWGSPPAIAHTDQIVGVGHRVVHGGEEFTESVAIDASVLRAIDALSSLAPLHNPINLEGIAATEALLPGAIGVAVFDTSFFATLPPRAYRYAVPERWWRRHGVRRYGFHGISHRYLVERAFEVLGKSGPNLVTFHLGAGASAAAVRGGRAVDTSMGLTPLEGLVMGTRSGDLDPAVVFHLMEAGLSASEIRRGLEMEGGLLGLSGVSSDFRKLTEGTRAGDLSAALAVEVFIHRIRRYLGAFLAQAAPCHGVVFSGGIGENSPEVRRRALQGLESLGLMLDRSRNERGEGERRISTDDSPIPIWVVPTDEELLIARDTARLVMAQQG